MGKDAPETPELEAQNEEEQRLLDAAGELEIVDVKGVDDFKDLPQQPDPFDVYYPKDDKLMRIKVQCRYPDDFDWFGTRFMDKVREAKTPVFEADNKEPKYPNRGAEFRLLRHECIITPVWLKNDEVFEKLPAPIRAEIHRRIQDAVGLDGDFFGDMARFSLTKSSLARLSESAKRSASSRTKSPPAAPPNKSSPTTSSSTEKASSTEPASSPTTSTSSP